MVHLSPEYNPPILKGIKIHPDNPFQFDFILDKGDNSPSLLQRGGQGELKQEAAKLIKYFLATITIPDKDLWVNLSPYEKNRIIPDSFGLTEMGRDMLAEDYMLKQITASLIYPEDEIGRKFWKRVYGLAAQKYGTTNIPINTFNKVWILPDKAVVYENVKAGTAYVVEAKLKVMLEQDYLSISKHQRQPGDMTSVVPPSRLPSDTALNAKAPQGNASSTSETVNALGFQITREIVIPELTREVNENKNFSQLRQVYNSLILATWYKNKIRDSILEEVYTDKNKISGVGYDNKENDVEFIYQRYLRAFKKGAFNYIKEEIDPLTQVSIPRKYFSGGTIFDRAAMAKALTFKEDAATLDQLQASSDKAEIVKIQLGQASVGSASGNSGVPDANMLRKWEIYDGQAKSILKRVPSIDLKRDLIELFDQSKQVVYAQRDVFSKAYRERTIKFIDAIFRKALAYPGGVNSTRIVFLKAGGEPLYDAARLMARVTGQFPVQRLHAIWGTMSIDKIIKKDRKQAMLFVKYLHDQNILTPETKNLLFVDTDVGRGTAGTSLIFARTLLDDNLIDEVNHEWPGLNIPKFNAGTDSIDCELYYMWSQYNLIPNLNVHFKREGILPGVWPRLKITGYFKLNDPDTIHANSDFLYIDRFIKTDNIDPVFGINPHTQEVIIYPAEVYDMPEFETDLEARLVRVHKARKLARAVQNAGLLMGILDVLALRGYAVEAEYNTLMEDLDNDVGQLSKSLKTHDVADLAMQAIQAELIRNADYPSFESTIQQYPDLQSAVLYNASLWDAPERRREIPAEYDDFDADFGEFHKKTNEQLAQALISFNRKIASLSMMEKEHYFSFFFKPDKYQGMALLVAFVSDIASNMQQYMTAIKRLYVSVPPGGLTKADVQEYLAILKTVCDRWKEADNATKIISPAPAAEPNTEPAVEPSPASAEQGQLPGLVEMPAAPPEAVKEETLDDIKRMFDPDGSEGVLPITTEIILRDRLAYLLPNSPLGLAKCIITLLQAMNLPEAQEKYNVFARPRGAKLALQIIEHRNYQTKFEDAWGVLIRFNNGKRIIIRRIEGTRQIVVVAIGWKNDSNIVNNLRIGISLTVLGHADIAEGISHSQEFAIELFDQLRAAQKEKDIALVERRILMVASHPVEIGVKLDEFIQANMNFLQFPSTDESRRAAMLAVQAIIQSQSIAANLHPNALINQMTRLLIKSFPRFGSSDKRDLLLESLFIECIQRDLSVFPLVFDHFMGFQRTKPGAIEAMFSDMRSKLAVMLKLGDPADSQNTMQKVLRIAAHPVWSEGMIPSAERVENYFLDLKTMVCLGAAYQSENLSYISQHPEDSRRSRIMVLVWRDFEAQMNGINETEGTREYRLRMQAIIIMYNKLIRNLFLTQENKGVIRLGKRQIKDLSITNRHLFWLYELGNKGAKDEFAKKNELILKDELARWVSDNNEINRRLNLGFFEDVAMNIKGENHDQAFQGGPGGIDLTAVNRNLQTSDGGIKFHLNQAMLQELQNSPGFYPRVISVEPLKNLQQFLINK